MTLGKNENPKSRRWKKCPHCCKILGSRYMKLHISAVHEKLRSFSCSFCKNPYSSSSALKQHISAIHKKIHSNAHNAQNHSVFQVTWKDISRVLMGPPKNIHANNVGKSFMKKVT